MWIFLRERMPNGAYMVQRSTGMSHVIHRADHPHTFFFLPEDTKANLIEREGTALWCREQFGETGTRWSKTGRVFRFGQQEDAFAFRLRWC